MKTIDEIKTDLAIRWLNKNFSQIDLDIVKIPNGKLTYYLKKDKIVMFHNPDAYSIWIDYYEIWMQLKHFFSMEYQEIEDIMKNWLGKNYGVRDVVIRCKDW